MVVVRSKVISRLKGGETLITFCPKATVRQRHHSSIGYKTTLKAFEDTTLKMAA